MMGVLCLLFIAAAPSTSARPSTSSLEALELRFGLEFSVGPYRPSVDGEFSEATPYADIFDDSSAAMYRLKVHAFAPTAAGDIGLSAGAGWFADSARALADDGGRSAGQTEVRLIPISILLRWRTTALEHWPGVPLALSLGAGLNYTFWEISKGDGAIAEAGGLDGNGGTLSAQVEGAVGLRLGQLDRLAAKRMDRQVGITDTEIGVALSYVSPPVGWWNALHVGDLNWQIYFNVAF